MLISGATVLCFILNDSKVCLVFKHDITSQEIFNHSEVTALASGYTF